ncbi:solute carrier family 2, facilitated glucose transporter member 9-like isoform X2 [Ambystoma mexicanum]
MIFVLGIGGGWQFGFQISVLNSPSPFIKRFINETWTGRYAAPISHRSLTLIWACIVSIFCLGGVIGSLASEYLIRKNGKKRCLVTNNLLLVAASLTLGCCKFAGFFEMLLIGRFLIGINTGLAVNLHYQYVGEIAPKKLRGFTNTTLALFTTFGGFTGQVLGLSECLGSESWWPLLISLNGITALIQVVTVPFFPESPSYLLLEKGDLGGCVEAMKQLWGEADLEEELKDLMKEQEARRNTQTLSLLELLRDRSSRWQVYMVVSLLVPLEFCGVNAMYFYSYSIFQDAGFSPHDIPHVTMGIGMGDVLSVIICCLLVDRFGMKTLLLAGYGITSGILPLLTLTLSLTEWYPWMAYCSVILVFTFVIFNGIGPGGVSTSIVVAIFSQSARPAGMVIMGFIGYCALYLIGMLFPYMVEILGQFCFLVFVSINMVLMAFFYMFLPETKGLSAMEISERFNKLNFRSCQDVPVLNACEKRQLSAPILAIQESFQEVLDDAMVIMEEHGPKEAVPVLHRTAHQ